MKETLSKLSEQRKERARQMLSLYMSGEEMTLEAVGKLFGVTRERVRQIITNMPGYEKRVSIPPEGVNCLWCGKLFIRPSWQKRVCCSSACTWSNKVYERERNEKNKTEKQCGKCLKIKSVGDFYWDKKGKCWKGICKFCHSLLVQRWNRAHPEKSREIKLRAAREWHKRNREELTAKSRFRYRTDPDFRRRRKLAAHNFYLRKKAKLSTSYPQEPTS